MRVFLLGRVFISGNPLHCLVALAAARAIKLAAQGLLRLSRAGPDDHLTRPQGPKAQGGKLFNEL